MQMVRKKPRKRKVKEIPVQLVSLTIIRAAEIVITEESFSTKNEYICLHISSQLGQQILFSFSATVFESKKCNENV